MFSANAGKEPRGEKTQVQVQSRDKNLDPQSMLNIEAHVFVLSARRKDFSFRVDLHEKFYHS